MSEAKRSRGEAEGAKIADGKLIEAKRAEEKLREADEKLREADGKLREADGMLREAKRSG
jgi:hypothetical protein